MTENYELKSVVGIHRAMEKYRDDRYINMIQQINTKTKAALTDDMGSQFVHNCGRDLAGEVVRSCFDTSSYYITVDQLAERILKFSYEDEYDPLKENGGVGSITKSVLNYNEINSGELERIAADMERSQAKLFTEKRSYSDVKAQKDYRESKRDENGDLFDELTGNKENKTTHTQNGKEVSKTDLQADHVQARESATYNSKYVTEKGRDELRDFYNSADNMQIMHASANASKGDVRVCQSEDGTIVNLNAKELKARQEKGEKLTDISYKATPEQLAQATVEQWEKDTPSGEKRQKLIDEGYLVEDENGNVHVPKSVKKKLADNIRNSQNQESKIILKNTDYAQVAKDAAKNTKADIGRIIAGQIIYYTAPPLVYEIRTYLKNKKAKLDDALEHIKEAAERIGNYVFSKLKEIFTNIVVNSLKHFIKSFMDILINLVKATIKKLLKIVKSLLLSTVDAVRIIADKNSTKAEKADSVFNLFGVTITACVVELLFELIENTFGIPEFLLTPLQILATVVCTNLTMLILQKADLFDVRFGFKINAVKEIFEEERQAFDYEMSLVESYSNEQIALIIQKTREECVDIYNNLIEFDPQNNSVRGDLERINRMFGMGIDFDSEWSNFTGSNFEKQPLLV